MSLNPQNLTKENLNNREFETLESPQNKLWGFQPRISHKKNPSNIEALNSEILQRKSP